MFKIIRILTTILLSLILAYGLSCSSKQSYTNKPLVKVLVDSSKIYCPSSNEDAIEYYNLGVMNGSLNEYDKAIENYLMAIELDSNYCDAIDNLARLYRVKGKYDEAINWYKKSIKIYPENNVAIQNLALVYRIKGEFDVAIKKYNTLIELYPNDPEGYYGLGECYKAIGEYEKAITAFKKSEAIYSDRKSPWINNAKYNLGICYILNNDCINCIRYFDQISSEFSSDIGLNYYLGICYLSEDNYDFEKAQKFLSKADSLGFIIPEEIKALLKNSSN